jgi:nitrogen fixation protein FixH
MKLNWGKSIVLAMILFIGFIMYMVVTMMSDKGYDHEMVVEEYYKKELTLNEKIESQKNGEAVKDNIQLIANPKGVLISLSEELADLKIAEFSAYRASDMSKDFTVKLNFNADGEALVNKPLISGVWEFSLSFTKDGKDYLLTDQINIE